MAIARRLAAMGASVTLIGRAPEPLRALADELSAAHPQRFVAVPVDVTDEARVERAFAEALAGYARQAAVTAQALVIAGGEAR